MHTAPGIGQPVDPILFRQLVPRVRNKDPRGTTMAEPSSSAAGGFVVWKAVGGLAGFAAVGAALSAVVALCMMTPRPPREWAVGLISTVICSLGGGAYVILKLGLLANLSSDPTVLYLSLVAGLGIVFACGLPGWAIVRMLFTFLEKRKNSDLLDVANEVRSAAGKAIAP
jgi:hypothetical protein